MMSSVARISNGLYWPIIGIQANRSWFRHKIFVVSITMECQVKGVNPCQWSIKWDLWFHGEKSIENIMPGDSNITVFRPYNRIESCWMCSFGLNSINSRMEEEFWKISKWFDVAVHEASNGTWLNSSQHHQRVHCKCNCNCAKQRWMRYMSMNIHCSILTAPANTMNGSASTLSECAASFNYKLTHTFAVSYA